MQVNTDENSEGYFDWAATAPVDATIFENALQVSANFFANPSSIHKKGLQAKNLLQETRKRCAKALDVQESQLIFTSGGTEANQLPILNLLQKPFSRQSTQSRGRIIISALEHPAIREQAFMMKHCGFDVVSILPDLNGHILPQSIVEKITPDTVLVCVMAVNNETGAIQPIYEIAEAVSSECKGKKRPKLHVDAVQAIGKIPLHLNFEGIDTVAISAHKICAPRGIGLLYMKERQEPFVRGGGQENGLRSGTENLCGALAFADCLEKYAFNENNGNMQTKLAKYFLSELAKFGARIIPEVRLDEHFAKQFSPWIIQASFPKIPGEVMVRALSEKGFYISTGSACSAQKSSRPILDAMKIPKEISQNAVRFSFGHKTTQANIEKLCAAIQMVLKDF